ncbi:MAG: RloB domain-containing protein [Kiritimatiellae bacterium]|nr:RloB domain-containing protein [Kiritimatiellia bacterium]
MRPQKIFRVGTYDESDTRRQGHRPVQRNILIVCEGEKTEPNYFKSIKRRMKSGAGSKVEVVGAGAHTRDLIKCAHNAIARRRAEGLPMYYHVWLVFDKDSFEADDFDNAISMAEAEKWHVAWSNEAFELWYLLHFQDVTGGALSRDSMFEMLGRHLGRKYLKNEANIFDTIMKQSYLAIDRARRLVERWQDQPPHKASPCTKVGALVEELLKYT